MIYSPAPVTGRWSLIISRIDGSASVFPACIAKPTVRMCLSTPLLPAQCIPWNGTQDLAGWKKRQQQEVIEYLRMVRLMYVAPQADAKGDGDFAGHCWRKPIVAVWLAM
jgi:hypothetical protein